LLGRVCRHNRELPWKVSFGFNSQTNSRYSRPSNPIIFLFSIGRLPLFALAYITSPPCLYIRASTPSITMALDTFFQNKIESMKLEIIQGQAKLRRLEAQRNDYNSRVRLLREELGLLQQPGSYVGEVVKVMSTKKVLVKVHPEGKYGTHYSTY
jgi:hypothetical protein